MIDDAMQERADLPDLGRRFGGLARLYGQKGAARIRHAHVVVVGIGGVGSWSVEALARSGVGRLTLIDMDHVAESNINRQVHALDGTLGQAKVQAMRERIAQINPECEVHCIEDFVQP
ncbi:ThiF family adenylyltransferase, partial [Leptospira sp. 96542]|nr:ThiF family adenylyltransferase [Leptospira sp. 96542]